MDTTNDAEIAYYHSPYCDYTKKPCNCHTAKEWKARNKLTRLMLVYADNLTPENYDAMIVALTELKQLTEKNKSWHI